MAVGVVGMIDNAHFANKLLEEEGIDVVAVGRGFQKNPGLVLAWEDELGIKVQMPHQIQWGHCRPRREAEEDAYYRLRGHCR